MSRIKLMIVDDVEETRINLKRLLQFEPDFKIIGEASNGEEAIRQVEVLRPDVILMDINMPIMDGLRAAEAISLSFPNTCIVILSVQGEPEYLKRAMMAGAREFLTKPFTSDELVNTIRRAYNLEKKRQNYRESPLTTNPLRTDPQVITLFSTKGGVGKTTLVTNLALALHHETGAKVVLLDLDLQFGDIAVHLNLVPARTIVDLVQDQSDFESESLNQYLTSQRGLKLLAAPLRPEYAELVTASHIEKVIAGLKEQYEFILIDTPATFNETTLAALDLSNQILLVTTLDLTAIKNTKLSLEVLESLHHTGKTRLVLNHANTEAGIRLEDLEKTLNQTIAYEIPSENKVVVSSVNRGIPFVVSHPGARVTQSIKHLALSLKQHQMTSAAGENAGKRSFLRRLISIAKLA